MLTKLLLTIAVIAAVLLMARANRTSKAAPQTSTAADKPQASPLRLSAWILIAVIVGVTVAVGAWQWLASPGAVTIRVVNSNTGHSVSYQAYPEQIGQRGFTSVDGRRITLAEVERMETSASP